MPNELKGERCDICGAQAAVLSRAIMLMPLAVGDMDPRYESGPYIYRYCENHRSRIDLAKDEHKWPI